jgi:hypothetical protein
MTAVTTAALTLSIRTMCMHAVLFTMDCLHSTHAVVTKTNREGIPGSVGRSWRLGRAREPCGPRPNVAPGTGRRSFGSFQPSSSSSTRYERDYRRTRRHRHTSRPQIHSLAGHILSPVPDTPLLLHTQSPPERHTSDTSTAAARCPPQPWRSTPSSTTRSRR